MTSSTSTPIGFGEPWPEPCDGSDEDATSNPSSGNAGKCTYAMSKPELNVDVRVDSVFLFGTHYSDFQALKAARRPSAMRKCRTMPHSAPGS